MKDYKSKKRNNKPMGNKGKGNINSRSGAPRRKRESASIDKDLPETNDFAWYNKYPELTNTIGKIPFPYRPGTRIEGAMSIMAPSATADGITLLNGDVPHQIPGVAAIDWIPTVGPSNDNLSPISLTARDLYARVRNAFSGSLAVDAPDLVLYVVAYDSIVSYLAYLKRVYRVVNQISPVNYYVPEGILKAMGFGTTDIEYLKAHKDDLLYKINSLILMSRRFVCPAVMPIFDRHIWLNERVYMDEPSTDAQMYVFNMKAVYAYGLVDTPDDVPAGGLTMRIIPTTADASGNVIDTLYNFGYTLISDFSGHEDTYTINGYFQRAFEGVEPVLIGILDGSEVVDFVFDQRVLEQIQNVVVPLVGSTKYNELVTDVTSSATVSQNPLNNSILSNVRFSVNKGTFERYGVYTPDGELLNINTVSPSVEDVVEATRLKPDWIYSLNPENAAMLQGEVKSCGTELPLGIFMYDPIPTMVKATGTSDIVVGSDTDHPSALARQLVYPVINISYTGYNNFGVNASGTPRDGGWTPYAAAMLQWKYHPIMWLLYSQQTNGVAQSNISDAELEFKVLPLGDTYNMTKVSEDILFNLHKVCLFSEFNAFNIK